MTDEVNARYAGLGSGEIECAGQIPLRTIVLLIAAKIAAEFEEVPPLRPT